MSHTQWNFESVTPEILTRQNLTPENLTPETLTPKNLTLEILTPDKKIAPPSPCTLPLPPKNYTPQTSLYLARKYDIYCKFEANSELLNPTNFLSIP